MALSDLCGRLSSFAQLGAPDGFRRPREVSVGTYTFRRCISVVSKARPGTGRFSSQKSPTRLCNLKTETAAGRWNRVDAGRAERVHGRVVRRDDKDVAMAAGRNRAGGWLVDDVGHVAVRP